MQKHVKNDGENLTGFEQMVAESLLVQRLLTLLAKVL